jgi:hypothetical protein
MSDNRLTLERMLAWIEALDADLKSVPDDNFRMGWTFRALMLLFDEAGKKDAALQFEKFQLWITDHHTGRPAILSVTWCSRALVAVAIEARMIADKATRETAAAWVVRHCDIHRLRSRKSSKDLVKLAIGWRDEFAKVGGRVKNRSACRLYDGYMQMLRSEAVGNEQKFAEHLLKLLAERA